jgi:two-component system OmpR family sensor kinase
VNLSFRTRLTLRWLIAFGVVLTVADLVVYVGVRQFLERDLEAQLRTLAGTELASAVDEPDEGLHLHELPARQSSAEEYADKFVQLITTDGRVLMQSHRLGTGGPLVEPSVLARALAGEAPVVDVIVNGQPGRMIALVTPGPERYVVAVGLLVDKLQATLGRVRLLLLAVWAGALCATGIVGFSLASQALGPVRRVTQQAAAIAGGQFGTRLDEPELDDEIAEMTRLLNQMLDRLRSALEANRRFAADASHELRSPLTAMIGELDVTLKRDRTTQEYREALTTLRQRLDTMSSLTADLMVLVRAQEKTAPPIGEVRVARSIARAMTRCQDAAAAMKLTCTVDVPPALVVYAEEALLERVFDNLLRNAVQYNIEGGSIAVTGRLTPGTGDWTPDDICIEVHNTGLSIPPEHRERVFERFYRLDPSRSRRTGGAGLGLAICREIVQLFKGAIDVTDSTEGTTIVVRLPGGTAT